MHSGQKKKPLSRIVCWDRSLNIRIFCGATRLGMKAHTLSLRTIIRKKLITEVSLRRAYFAFGLLSEDHSPPGSALQFHHLQLSVPD